MDACGGSTGADMTAAAARAWRRDRRTCLSGTPEARVVPRPHSLGTVYAVNCTRLRVDCTRLRAVRAASGGPCCLLGWHAHVAVIVATSSFLCRLVYVCVHRAVQPNCPRIRCRT